MNWRNDKDGFRTGKPSFLSARLTVGALPAYAAPRESFRSSPCFEAPAQTFAMVTKTSSDLTLFDRLSRLTFLRATKVLAPDGKRLLHGGGAYEIDLENRSS